MSKSKILLIAYWISLLLFTTYVILDTLVISESYQVVSDSSTDEKESTGEIISDDTTYEDNNIKINIKTYREYDTTIYVADIVLSSSKYLKTGFAKNTYGKNITEKTSTISDNLNAILAINGDYYGVQEYGYVLKNGVVYRNEVSSNQEDLVIYKDGSFEVINEDNISLEELVEKGAYNILSFGPALIKNGIISVSTNDEVDKSMSSNPRTAIGIINSNHYIFVVSDGRTNESEGLSLYQLANFMKNLGVNIAYNLDGGGSSTMYFNGSIINNPTTTGHKISERSVSDIVYIGYWYI